MSGQVIDLGEACARRTDGLAHRFRLARAAAAPRPLEPEPPPGLRRTCRVLLKWTGEQGFITDLRWESAGDRLLLIVTVFVASRGSVVCRADSLLPLTAS